MTTSQSVPIRAPYTPAVQPPLKPGEALQLLLLLGKHQIPNAKGGMNAK